ncbi:MAG: hypothetical protein WCS52_01930 [bacterium]
MADSSNLLPWAKASRSNVRQNEQSNDESITLQWQNVVDKDRAAVVAELYAIGSVTDLIIDNGRVTYPGVWRNAGCGWDGRTENYYMELRKGWATTTPEAMSVYVNVIRNNQSGKLTLIRKWQFIDPSVAEKLMKSQNANPKVLSNVVTDPMADGKVYEGEWLAVTTEGPKSVQDGCTIIQTLIKAGDANLTVILGTNKTTSSRECYKWQTTAEDLEAFRTHTGVYAEEFDYKWGTNEVGIQKDWQPSQNGDDKSLNLVAKYIVKEFWQYPAGNDFVIVKDFGGIFKESVQKFKNKSTIPVAQAPENGAQLVKALENDLGQFDGEIINRVISGAAIAGFVTVSSSIYEWDLDKSDVKLPIWTSSTNSDIPQKITGYNVFQFRLYTKRTVDVSITRSYSATHPGIVDAATSTAGSKGAGTSVIKHVLEISEGLYAIETKTITTGEWVVSDSDIIPLYSTP